MAIATINPATGEVVRKFEALSPQQIDQKLSKAAQTWQEYRWVPIEERAKCMAQAAEIMEKEKEEFGRLMTLEMGKTLKSAVEEAVKCAWACRYYVENAARFLADEPVQTNATRSYIRYLPIGPVLAVMPWNFPFWQVFRFAAPSLMAGNVGLLKHASNVPQCALAIEDVFRRAGFPEGAFQTLLIGSSQVKAVIEDPRVKAVTLTGSGPAGSQVASEAGRVIKKTVLELGGSDPFIVMPSCDLDEAAQTAVKARAINNGQSCIAAKRFIVHEAIADEFTKRFVEGMASLKVGDPMDPATDIGPLATDDIRETLKQQVDGSVAKGAKLLTGGKSLPGKGFYYAPSVLTDIPREAPAFDQEVFGPAALLFKVKDINAAIQLANNTEFGLGSSAWTRDPDEQQRFINELQAGMTFINGMVASDPRLPFGGVKESGYGRELSSFGIHEFVNIKAVWIKEGDGHNRTDTE